MAWERLDDVTARVMARLETRIAVRDSFARLAGLAANENGSEAGTARQGRDNPARPGLVRARGGCAQGWE